MMPETITRPVAAPQDRLTSAPVTLYPSKLTLDLPPEATGIFQKMLDETEMSPAEMVWNALSLLSVARDARQNGLAVGAAESADKLEVEFIDF